MEIVLLRAFVAVAESGNFGRAAVKLAVTQPALTKQMQALERRLGGRLFTRGRHGADLTDLGRELLPEARDLLARAGALAERAGRLTRGESGRISIGFGLSSIQLAPRAVAAFRRRYPAAEITLDDMSSKVQLDRLRAGDLHAGFVRAPVGGFTGRPHLASHVVGTDRLAIASPGATQDEIAQWSAGGPMIRLARSRGPGLVDQIDHWCSVRSLRPRVLQEAQDLQTVLALVAAGAGTAIVPASAAGIAPPGVHLQPLEDAAATWQVVMAWRQDDPSALVTNFVETVRGSQ